MLREKIPNKQLKIIFVAIGIIVLFGVIGGGYYWISGTPQYSLYQIGRAVENRDSETFYKYVDIDSVVNSFTDWAWKEMEEMMAEEKPEDEWASWGYELGKGFAELMMPAMKERIKEGLRSEITKTIEGTEEGMQEAFKKISYKDIKIERSGKIANVEILNFLESDISLKLKMRQATERYWKVVEINPEMLESMGIEEKEEIKEEKTKEEIQKEALLKYLSGVSSATENIVKASRYSDLAAEAATNSYELARIIGTEPDYELAIYYMGLAKTEYKDIQKKLKKLTVPPEAQKYQSHIEDAIEKFLEATEMMNEFFNSSDVDILESGLKIYKEAKDGLDKAIEEAKRLAEQYGS